MKLRPYQLEAVEQARAMMRRGVRRILIRAPTGSGKTVLAGSMLATSASKGSRCWFNVHRRELVRQSSRTLRASDVAHGIIAPKFLADPRQLVQVCSIPTIARRMDRLAPPRLIVWDECHHIASASWSTIAAAYPDAFHIGLSATPERLDGRGLDFFQAMIQGPDTAWLIEQGFLSPYDLYVPSGGVSVDNIHSRAGDYVKAELEAAIDRPTITGDAVDHYRRRAPGSRALVRCVSIRHSVHVVEQFQAAGFSAAHCDGDTDPHLRDQLVSAFERGELRVLSNVDLFSEGFDLPALEVGIDLRPTESLTYALQFWGRVLRTAPGKERGIIHDHANNSGRHGLPCDAREWTLQGRKKRKASAGEITIPVRVCPGCYAQNPAARTTCFACGIELGGAAREVEEVPGELQKVDKEQVRRSRLREQSTCATFEDLVALGQARGYARAHAWAKHIFEARASKHRSVEDATA